MIMAQSFSLRSVGATISTALFSMCSTDSSMQTTHPSLLCYIVAIFVCAFLHCERKEEYYESFIDNYNLLLW